MDWTIETWDVGYYQIRNAMKSLGGSQFTCDRYGNGRNKLRPSR